MCECFSCLISNVCESMLHTLWSFFFLVQTSRGIELWCLFRHFSSFGLNTTLYPLAFFIQILNLLIWLFRWLSGSDLKKVALFGCPSIAKKTVFSAKRLRTYFRIQEDNVTLFFLGYSQNSSRLLPYSPYVLKCYVLISGMQQMCLKSVMQVCESECVERRYD